MENRVICHCMDITYTDVKNAVEEGAKDLDAIKEATEAITVCGVCEDEIQEVLDELVK